MIILLADTEFEYSIKRNVTYLLNIVFNTRKMQQYFRKFCFCWNWNYLTDLTNIFIKIQVKKYNHGHVFSQERIKK